MLNAERTAARTRRNLSRVSFPFELEGNVAAMTSPIDEHRYLRRTCRGSRDRPHYAAVDAERCARRRRRLRAADVCDHCRYLIRGGESLQHRGGAGGCEEFPF